MGDRSTHASTDEESHINVGSFRGTNDSSHGSGKSKANLGTKRGSNDSSHGNANVGSNVSHYERSHASCCASDSRSHGRSYDQVQSSERYALMDAQWRGL